MRLFKQMRYLKRFENVISDTEWLDITNESFYDLTDNGFSVLLYKPGDNITSKGYYIVIKSDELYQLSEVLPTIKQTLSYLSEYKFKLKRVYYQEVQNKQTGIKIIPHELRDISKVCPNLKTRSIQIKLKRI